MRKQKQSKQALKKVKRADDAIHVVNPVPAQWTINRWPKDVFPFNPSRGKRLCLEHRDSLIQHLVLSRPVREIIVNGSAYMKWISSHAGKVADYAIAPNSKV